MTFVLLFILSAAAAYLLGSLSCSILFTRVFTGADVRRHGSHNAGATNVLRIAGRMPAILAFVGDFLKCVAAILAADLLSQAFHASPLQTDIVRYCAGIFCILGHIYPVYFGFRGGKGVTSAAALLLMLDWRVFAIGISLFILLVILTRLVSLSSICAVFSVVLLTFVFGWIDHSPYILPNTLLIAVMAGIIIGKHAPNIKRLLNGTEKHIHEGRAPRVHARKPGRS